MSGLFESSLSKVDAGGHIKRRLTKDEKEEFKGAAMLKRKITLM